MACPAMNPRDLPHEWRAQAETYERDGAYAQAAVLRRVAEELEAAWTSHELEELPVAQAAQESGYSEEHLRALVREGRIPDNRPPGSQGEMRIRRCDLPRKPGAQRPTLSVVEDMASQILAVRR